MLALGHPPAHCGACHGIRMALSSSIVSRLVVGVVFLASFGRCVSAAQGGPPDRAFFDAHCIACHDGSDAQGKLNFATLAFDLNSPESERMWINIHDRIQQGEMPPPDTETLSEQVTQPVLESLGKWISQHQRKRQQELGRTHGRRLTHRELERTLHSLLGIDLPLLNRLPEESISAEFSTMPSGQSFSYFDLEHHLSVVDLSLDEAFSRALAPRPPYQRHFSAKEIVREDPKRRTREPELREGKAVVWSAGVIYYGRTPVTTAKFDGWYRFQIKISGLKLPKSGGVWTTVYSGRCVSSAPILNWVTAFEVTEEPRIVEFEAWIPRGDMLEIRPGDITLKRARFEGGQIGTGEGEPQNVPGIAIDWIKMEKIHRGPDDEEVGRRLFGDYLPIVRSLARSPSQNQKKSKEQAQRPVPLTNDQLDELMVDFATRAFRRPTTREEIASYCENVHSVYEQNKDVVAALRLGYRAILCSPRFLYFMEAPGPLDSYAIASRLSYLLTGGPPDDELMLAAREDRLRDPKQVRQQVERLLAGPAGRTFVEDFADEWLDLKDIEFTEPDRKLVPDFDKIVQHSMLEETRLFLETMLRENQSVTRLVSSKETFLNSRLARYYGIPDVKGDQMQRVALPQESHRSGLITHGAILKVTANGSETSPVTRGAWVAERILGYHIPPPPENVPAIEPDIRGATTIRELLEKHRSDDACRRCHVKIDPAGFALENFDPGGKWREAYRTATNRKKELPIDPASVLPDGRPFANLNEFQQLVAEKPEVLARNLAEKLIAYGTGAPVSFADREELEQIVDQTKEDNFGFRSIVHAVTTSPLFLQK